MLLLELLHNLQTVVSIRAANALLKSLAELLLTVVLSQQFGFPAHLQFAGKVFDGLNERVVVFH